MTQRVRAARALAVAAFGALATLAAPAAASPTYPGAIQDALEMTCAPPCTICHQNLQGGFGTIVTDFGINMQIAGLPPTKPELVAGVLAEVEASGSDVDGDGVGDVAELRDGSDPNGDDPICGPTYGCGASIAGDRAAARGSWGAAALLAAALGLVARRLAGGSRRGRRAS